MRPLPSWISFGVLCALPATALANPALAAPGLRPPENPVLNAEPASEAEETDKPVTRFTTTVQIAVQERSPELTARGQKLVVDQLKEVFQEWPEFEGHPYHSSLSGKEVVFYVTSPRDMRKPMERAMAHMISTLDGRVRVRGRSQFYRTSLEQPMEGMLEVVTDDQHNHILSISAQSVPLRDILKEIRHQVGGFSYLIPGNCAKQVVDWSFGDDPRSGQAKTLDMAMEELGTLFKLKLERQNHTFIFRGECQHQVRTARRNPLAPPPELLQSHIWSDLPNAPLPRHPGAAAANGPRTTEVVFPLVPLAQ